MLKHYIRFLLGLFPTSRLIVSRALLVEMIQTFHFVREIELYQYSNSTSELKIKLMIAERLYLRI